MIRETDADAIRLAKTLIRGARFGALAVIEPGTGSPLASRVGIATDIDGAPLILVSMLSAPQARSRGPALLPACWRTWQGRSVGTPTNHFGMPGAAA